ncbi:MAG: hypothetical protein GC150_17060 [Rhizobiales bacterium]|nr:hypothetical protein [Hyphomicrobiales bacterium]
MDGLSLRTPLVVALSILLCPAPLASAKTCKEDPVEVNHCAVQVRGQPPVQDVAIGKWRNEVRDLYGPEWSSWENAGGRIRCREVGAEICCNVAAVPCKP